MALFRTQHQALAIHVNAAAFENHVVRLAVASDYRHELLELKFLADAIGKLVVMLPVRILGPGIEAPVSDRDIFLALYENGAGIARPYPVSWPDVELHALGLNVATFQHIAGHLFFAG